VAPNLPGLSIRTINASKSATRSCDAGIGALAFLAGEQLLPGFHFPIADLFKEWDWD
jgi:hypothetical protein